MSIPSICTEARNPVRICRSSSTCGVGQTLDPLGPACDVNHPCTITVGDKVVRTTPRTYGDLVRRMTDLSQLEASRCFSSGVFDELQFMPMTGGH